MLRFKYSLRTGINLLDAKRIFEYTSNVIQRNFEFGGDAVKPSYAVNKKIARIVRDRGIKQTYVAARARMSYSDINRIVNSQRPVYADELQSIANALDTSIDELLNQPDTA